MKQEPPLLETENTEYYTFALKYDELFGSATQENTSGKMSPIGVDLAFIFFHYLLLAEVSA